MRLVHFAPAISLAFLSGCFERNIPGRPRVDPIVSFQNVPANGKPSHGIGVTIKRIPPPVKVDDLKFFCKSEFGTTKSIRELKKALFRINRTILFNRATSEDQRSCDEAYETRAHEILEEAEIEYQETIRGYYSKISEKIFPLEDVERVYRDFERVLNDASSLFLFRIFYASPTTTDDMKELVEFGMEEFSNLVVSLLREKSSLSEADLSRLEEKLSDLVKSYKWLPIEKLPVGPGADADEYREMATAIREKCDTDLNSPKFETMEELQKPWAEVGLLLDLPYVDDALDYCTSLYGERTHEIFSTARAVFVESQLNANDHVVAKIFSFYPGEIRREYEIIENMAHEAAREYARRIMIPEAANELGIRQRKTEEFMEELVNMLGEKIETACAVSVENAHMTKDKPAALLAISRRDAQQSELQSITGSLYGGPRLCVDVFNSFNWDLH